MNIISENSDNQDAELSKLLMTFLRFTVDFLKFEQRLFTSYFHGDNLCPSET